MEIPLGLSHKERLQWESSEEKMNEPVVRCCSVVWLLQLLNGDARRVFKCQDTQQI